MSLAVQKKVLRKTVSETLRALSASDIEEQSRRVRERVLALDAFRSSRSVSCYLSMPSGELDTSLLAQNILTLGKTLFVPKIVSTTADAQMRFLRIYDTADLQAVKPVGKWGIREPLDSYGDAPRQDARDASAADLDVILVPGVAFDRACARLGHGKGYYDQFFTAYTQARPARKPYLIALGLNEQMMEVGQVPMGEHDWRVDVVVTPEGSWFRDDQ
ncbi:5-formyltetrahydrofolate cyclo-ligase [Cylindrobasidium torrendii FP15055 ss-10]|uniref:5-formyltetrahydrofolate cyclo-ligase n=1 Tax=Cylindrobasidium torrendii FP15055 ss-10 TaxID=1314674 RepID=A0A0D7AWE7_9AGAR|nr:5-formyltetrahydrofolate cyclo-ligase [Cylindrobasidium torrendii FP15055 ss-10]